MLLTIYIIFVVWGFLLIRAINKDTIKSGDPIESGANLIALLVAILPILNMLGCIVVTGFFLDDWFKKLDKEKVTRFWKKIFFIS